MLVLRRPPRLPDFVDEEFLIQASLLLAALLVDLMESLVQEILEFVRRDVLLGLLGEIADVLRHRPQHLVDPLELAVVREPREDSADSASEQRHHVRERSERVERGFGRRRKGDDIVLLLLVSVLSISQPPQGLCRQGRRGV